MRVLVSSIQRHSHLEVIQPRQYFERVGIFVVLRSSKRDVVDLAQKATVRIGVRVRVIYSLGDAPRISVRQRRHRPRWGNPRPARHKSTDERRAVLTFSAEKRCGVTWDYAWQTFENGRRRFVLCFFHNTSQSSHTAKRSNAHFLFQQSSELHGASSFR